MPNMEELISKISAEITKNDGDIWMSKIDLDYVMVKQNYPKKQPNIVFSQLPEEILPGITVSRRVLTVYWIFPRYCRNT